MLMFSFLFCDRMCFFSGSESVDVLHCLYIYLLSLNIHLSKGEWWCHSPFNPVTFLYRNQARTLISNVICRDSHFCISELRWEVILRVADICGIFYPKLYKLSFRNTSMMLYDEGGSIFLIVSILTSAKIMPKFVQAGDYNRVACSVSLTI